MTIKLTKEQAALIHWALHAGHEQHVKFLRHDDWDVGMNEELTREANEVEQKLVNAAKFFEKAFMKAIGEE